MKQTCLMCNKGMDDLFLPMYTNSLGRSVCMECIYTVMKIHESYDDKPDPVDLAEVISNAMCALECELADIDFGFVPEQYGDTKIIMTNNFDENSFYATDTPENRNDPFWTWMPAIK